MSSSIDAGYAGDAMPQESLDAIMTKSAAQLVDVRTTAEWAYVGSPDLRAAGKEPIRLEWQVFPTMAVDPDFVAKLEGALEARGLSKDAPLYFLCRSGVRSKAAAIAMAAAGHSNAFNVAGGFEGPPDAEGHRGRISGWKAEGLPWIQS
jgi:rhodanese-related sulfurtransferase